MNSTDSAGDIESVKTNIASGNGLTATATAKAAVVDVSGATMYFNGSSRKHEPFLSASLRARIQAKAQSTYVDSTLDNIKKVETSNIDDAAKVAIIDLINQSLAHHLNLESIMDKAVNSPDLSPQANPDGLNPEWADEFAERAGSKYDEDAQTVWAKLLTGELNNPGSYSRKAMRLLDDMEPEDARAFEKLCSACIGGPTINGEWQEMIPLFIDEGQELVMSAVDLNRLKDLGLINFSYGSVAGLSIITSFGDGGWQLIQVDDKAVAVSFEKGKAFHVEKRTFTKYGAELSKLCHVGQALSEDGLLVRKFKEAGGKVGLVVELLPDGQFRMLPL